MSDVKQQQDGNREVPVTEVASGPTAPTTAPSAELLAWVGSLGPGGAERFTKASELMAEMGAVISKAGAALKDNAVGELEDSNRRAKVLAARAEVSGFDWLSELVRGWQIMIGSYLRFAQGNRAVPVFRHQRAKQEFQAATTGIRESVDLLDRALSKFPQVPEFAQARVYFQRATYINRQLQTFILALEKNCDVDTLLLQGRVREYLVGVRALAGELRRMSDSMLATGSDDPEILGLSAKSTTLADTLEERAEVISEIESSRNIYLPPEGAKVFIVHGHAEDKWRELRDLLEDRLGLKGRVVVLKEEAGRAKTVIEKFEEHAKQCCYGFALVTPDDEVRKQDLTYRQARPNVMFEIGWFYGRFGPSRLCILTRTGTEIPSDLRGVVTIEFDKAVSEKFLEINQELVAAGVVAE